jgi:hypothetical protein
MSREVAKSGYTKLDMGGVRKERSEGLEYHQRTSHGQGCMEACYPCATTMSWLRDLMGFASSLPNLFGTKGFVVVVENFMVNNSYFRCILN